MYSIIHVPPFSSRTEFAYMYKYKQKLNAMKLNVHVVSRPKCPALSNGALAFCCKSNILYRKMSKPIHENFVCIQPPFPAFYSETKCTIRKSVKFWSRNNNIRIYISLEFEFADDFCGQTKDKGECADVRLMVHTVPRGEPVSRTHIQKT